MKSIILIFSVFLCTFSSYSQTVEKDYEFILTIKPALTMQHPKGKLVPDSGRWKALSYDFSTDIAFIYNDVVCGYYKVPQELAAGFENGCKNLQETNPTRYWQRVEEIMNNIDNKQKQLTPSESPKKLSTDDKNEGKIYDVVEQMPSFPGGTAALMQYLSKSIKYPTKAEENGIQGRVICTFIVEADGTITNISVNKSIEPSLDKEAVRVISLMPKWIPGRQNGNPIRTNYTLPVTFRLQ